MPCRRHCGMTPRPPAAPHPRLGLVVVALLLTGPVAAAQTPQAVSDLVDLRYTLRQQQARVDVAKWEVATAAGARVPVHAPTPKLQDLVGAALLGTSAKLPAPTTGPSTSLVTAWREAEAKRIEFQTAVISREKDYGFSFADRTPPPFRLKLYDIIVLGWAGVALFIGCMLAAHERRLSVRRWSRSRLRGGIAAALAVGMLALAGCQGLDAPRPPQPESTPQAVQDATTQAKAEADEINRQMDGRHGKLIEAWAQFAGANPANQQTLLAADTEVLKRVRDAAVNAALEERLAADILAAANLEAEQTALNALTASAATWSTVYTGTRVAAAAVLALIVAYPFRVARRRAAAEARKSSLTCPRCLEVGTLAVHRTATAGGKAGEYKESTYVECKACENRIARSHQKIPRLCFPTVGIRASGKTHMLTTAYAAIKNRIAPTRASVQTAPSVMDERFRQYIDLILRHRGEAGATVHDGQYLDPLLIHTRDLDKWGHNGVLVNLFDYSGELLEQTPIAEALGPRAMLMDGFMMFFDPTQIYGDAGVTLQDQIQALDDFYNRMAVERGLPPGTLIPNPVAVCITKFDLLESENPIGGQCLPFIQELNGPLKPGDGQAVSLATLKARSSLVESMLPLLFPGVDLGRLVREYFGTQMLFFPMSSVNLNIDEFGRVDASGRNPAPYGVVEPILWLLHMHGYNVLDAR